jgi:limonene-1,2-epoxide hydrolase
MAGETKKSIKDLVKGPNPSLFATFAASLLSNDWDTVEARLADNIEWNMMPNNQIRKGKKEVIQFLKASYYAAKRMPKLIHDQASKDWGCFEYYNIGTTDKNVIEFAKQSKWAFPNPGKLVGRKYKVPVCFVWHINPKGKIDLVREYLDVGSLVAQFK